MREAMFDPAPTTAKRMRSGERAGLKVALVGRAEERHRNVVYDSAVVPGASGGRALLIPSALGKHSSASDSRTSGAAARAKVSPRSSLRA